MRRDLPRDNDGPGRDLGDHASNLAHSEMTWFEIGGEYDTVHDLAAAQASGALGRSAR